jgi:hypothetical protein
MGYSASSVIAAMMGKFIFIVLFDGLSGDFGCGAYGLQLRRNPPQPRSKFPLSLASLGRTAFGAGRSKATGEHAASEPVFENEQQMEKRAPLKVAKKDPDYYSPDAMAYRIAEARMEALEKCKAEHRRLCKVDDANLDDNWRCQVCFDDLQAIRLKEQMTGNSGIGIMLCKDRGNSANHEFCRECVDSMLYTANKDYPHMAGIQPGENECGAGATKEEIERKEKIINFLRPHDEKSGHPLYKELKLRSQFLTAEQLNADLCAAGKRCPVCSTPAIVGDMQAETWEHVSPLLRKNDDDEENEDDLPYDQSGLDENAEISRRITSTGITSPPAA